MMNLPVESSRNSQVIALAHHTTPTNGTTGEGGTNDQGEISKLDVTTERCGTSVTTVESSSKSNKSTSPVFPLELGSTGSKKVEPVVQPAVVSSTTKIASSSISNQPRPESAVYTNSVSAANVAAGAASAGFVASKKNHQGETPLMEVSEEQKAASMKPANDSSLKHDVLLHPGSPMSPRPTVVPALSPSQLKSPVLKGNLKKPAAVRALTNGRSDTPLSGASSSNGTARLMNHNNTTGAVPYVPKMTKELFFEKHKPSAIIGGGVGTAAAFVNMARSKTPFGRSIPKLLCLHGRNANIDISKIQVSRLGLDQEFTVTYLQGPYPCSDSTSNSTSNQRGGPLSSYPGPRYSWIESTPDIHNDRLSMSMQVMNGGGETVTADITMSEDFTLSEGDFDEEESYEDYEEAMKEFYSSTDVFKSMIDQESLFRSLYMILKHCQAHGPYDAVYGFSQGAALAAVLSMKAIRRKILAHFGEDPSCASPVAANGSSKPSRRESHSSTGTGGASNLADAEPWKFVFSACAANDMVWRSAMSLLSAPASGAAAVAGGGLYEDEHFDFHHDIDEASAKLDIPSAHFIGLQDDFKTQSETYLMRYDPRRAFHVYLDAGHLIPEWMSSSTPGTTTSSSGTSGGSSSSGFGTNPYSQARKWYDFQMSSKGNGGHHSHHQHHATIRSRFSKSSSTNPSPLSNNTATTNGSNRALSCYSSDNKSVASSSGMSRTSGWSKRSTASNKISALVNMEEEIQDLMDDHVDSIPGMHGQYFINCKRLCSDLSLLDLLRKNPSNATAIQASSEAGEFLTYGELIDFIEGPGNLSQLGVQNGDRVAYVASGGVLSAVAFLTFTSQTTSVPLDPTYLEKDYLLAFEQIKPTIVILLGSEISTADVIPAASQFGITVVRANVMEDSCGLFEFAEGSLSFSRCHEASSKPLMTHPLQDALILRTSGTTSAPKIVPLKMHALMYNALAIAESLGLTSDDVSLNAMQLYHIGGIAANLLATLLSGGTVIMMAQFDVVEFWNVVKGGCCRRAGGGGIKPTWYSAVPTMHAAICALVRSDLQEESSARNNAVDLVQFDAEVNEEPGSASIKHSLRFIRTGAAAMSIDLANELEEVLGVPIIPTYSMTELMPISQPPTGYDMLLRKPHSVGRPLVASMAVVGPNLKPLPYETPVKGSAVSEPVMGEICISGPTMLEAYENNPTANANAFFVLGGTTWFRTGDLGHLDREGFLFITGRSKDMIKRGGDQVSPVEVEDILDTHPVIKKAIVFAVPDPLWGERVGAAIVLEDEFVSENTSKRDQQALKSELRYYFSQDSLLVAPKYPEEIVFVTMDDLPKTKSGKYIRKDLSDLLGITERLTKEREARKPPQRVHPAADGMRFVLALAVCYVHIGSLNAGKWRQTSEVPLDTMPREIHGWMSSRGWCIHTPLFFLLGGFFIASGTGAAIETWAEFKRYYMMRFLSLHPMYLISVLACTINLVMRCGPSNYIPTFDRLRQPLEGEYFVCQATPMEMSYGGTLTMSIATYVLGLQSWPFMIPFSWFISFYSWFSSVFYFCVFAFPWIHRVMFRARHDLKQLWKIASVWIFLHFVYIGIMSAYFWLDDDPAVQNFYALSSYLLPIGWLPSFSFGVCMFFMFQHYNEGRTKRNKRNWGYATDIISLTFLTCWLFYGLADVSVPPHVVTAQDERQWFAYISRILVVGTVFWAYGLAIGGGLTARLFSCRFMVEHLAPASYNMFLFHQPISEWYFYATRQTWWAYPKSFYWFSPYPVPIHFWEFPIVMFIIISVCMLLERYLNNPLIGFTSKVCRMFVNLICCRGRHSSSFGLDGFRGNPGMSAELMLVKQVVKSMTQYEVNKDTLLVEAGINSIMSSILLNKINRKLPNQAARLNLADLRGVDTVENLADVIQQKAIKASEREGKKKRSALDTTQTTTDMGISFHGTDFESLDDSDEEEDDNDIEANNIEANHIEENHEPTTNDGGYCNNSRQRNPLRVR